LAASGQLAIRDLPSVVLMDGDSRVQFATSITGDDLSKNQWANDLLVAMKRVAAGENLADEMLAQYQDFMTRYKTALGRVDASSLLPTNLKLNAAGSNTAQAGSDVLPTRTSPPALVARRKWVSRDFKVSASAGFDRRATADGMCCSRHSIGKCLYLMPAGSLPQSTRGSPADSMQPSRIFACWKINRTMPD